MRAAVTTPTGAHAAAHGRLLARCDRMLPISGRLRAASFVGRHHRDDVNLWGSARQAAPDPSCHRTPHPRCAALNKRPQAGLSRLADASPVKGTAAGMLNTLGRGWPIGRTNSRRRKSRRQNHPRTDHLRTHSGLSVERQRPSRYQPGRNRALISYRWFRATRPRPDRRGVSPAPRPPGLYAATPPDGADPGDLIASADKAATLRAALSHQTQP